MNGTNQATPLQRMLVLTDSRYFPPFIEDAWSASRAGDVPRQWLAELPHEKVILDQRLLTKPTKWRRALYRLLPSAAAQVLEAYRVRHEFDVIFAWGAERVALPLSILLRLSRAQVCFVGLFSWISAPRKAALLRLGKGSFTRLILPPEAQRTFAIHKLGVDAARVAGFQWPVDADFWDSKRPPQRDYICAVGREMRDYATLLAALDGLDIRCHIAAPFVAGKKDQWKRHTSTTAQAWPENVTFGQKSAVGLRDLYERSAAVVLPLLDSDTDNGVTSMLEAWSMSRPVICSSSSGQAANLALGKGVVAVPPGDPDALRKALQQLLDNPSETERLGREGRQLAAGPFSVDRFLNRLTAVLDEAITERPRVRKPTGAS